jgi:outer membrane protein OmpA-like peptidoglycan-associated protein
VAPGLGEAVVPPPFNPGAAGAQPEAGAGEDLVGGPSALAAWRFLADLGGSVMLSQPQATLFRPGVSGSIAALRAITPSLLLGLRLRGAIFTDGDPPVDDNRADPSLGGLGAALLTLRWRPAATADEPVPGIGPWLDMGAGGGLTGKLVRPVAELGVGWAFLAGPVLAGPMVRYHNVFQSGDDNEGADARILLAGVEFSLRTKGTRPPPPPPPPPPPSAPPPLPIDSDGDGILDQDDRCPSTPEDLDGFEDGDGCPDEDNDRDGIPDAMDKCPDQPEVVNGVEDQDGCPDEGLITMVDDRVVLQEEVLFETDRSRVSSSGRRALEAVERLCRQHPEWEHLEVEGHADERGTAEYNQRLSEDRATRVREVLLELGFADDRVTVKGFGATRPRVQGRDEESLRLNRRVELVVVGKKPAGATTAPAAPAAIPKPAPLVPRPRKPSSTSTPTTPGKSPTSTPGKPGAPSAAPTSDKSPEPKPPGPPPKRSKTGLFEGVEEGQ